MSNYSKEELKDFIILKHPCYSGSAFDFIVKEDKLNDKRVLEVKESLYNVPCSYANRFLKLNQGYVLIGSEDNGHIPEFNWIEKWVEESLEDKDFQLIEDDSEKALKFLKEVESEGQMNVGSKL